MPDQYSDDEAVAHHFADLERDIFSLPRRGIEPDPADADLVRTTLAGLDGLLAELEADAASGEPADGRSSPSPISDTGDAERPSTGLRVEPSPAFTDDRSVNGYTGEDRLPDDKSVNRPTRKSLFRDAEFVREFQHFAGDHDPETSPISGETSVIEYKGVTPSPSLPLPSGTDTTSPWYQRYVAPPARPHRTPAEWRDTTDPLRAHYHHLALRQLGPVHSFTANLLPHIESRARSASNGPLDWLHRRIGRQLHKHLGRRVEFYLAIEETDDRRLHLHGEIGIGPDDAEIARKALRLACGEWTSARQFQVDTKPSPDSSWPSYALKHHWKTTPFARSVLAGSSLAVTFTGPVLSVTADLRRHAEALYTKHRAELIAKSRP